MQKLVKGENCIQELPSLLKGGGDAIFLVTGLHLKDKIPFTIPPTTNIHHCIKIGPNVEAGEIETALAEFRKANYSNLVAIGGGSAIDLAKGILHRLATENLPLPFFVVAPTTTGSGSEATHFAVVYNGFKKSSLVHPGLLPQLVLLDPQLAYSLSSYQLAVTGMDVLSQAVESWWNKNATSVSKEYATESIELWKEHFSTAFAGDKGAIEKMLWAAHLSGKAINITRTTGPHALSYYLTSQHGVAHGQAVALLLPAFFLYNNADSKLCSLLKSGSATEAANHIRQVMKKARLATTLAELGIDKEAIVDDLLAEVNEERFANNPEAFDQQKLKELLLTHL